MTLRITYFDQDPEVATLQKLPHGFVTEVTSIAASVFNGRPCVVTMNLAGRIRIWDPDTGVELRELVGSGSDDSTYWAQDWNSIMYPIDIDGQAHVVVSASFADIQCWNLATGQQLCTAPDRVQTEPRIWLESMIVRKGADGRWRVITVIEDGHVHVLDPMTGRAIMPSQQAPVDKLEQIVTVPSEPEVLACVTWNGEVLSWDAETMSLGVEVTPIDSQIEEILGFTDEDGAPYLAAAACDPVGVLERRNLATGEAMEPWAASWMFTLANTPEFGSIAATVTDGVFQARRLSNGECVLELPCSIAGLWRVLPCTNARGDARWACFFASELCMLDPANGRWSEPIVVTSPVRGRQDDGVHDICTLPGGRLAIGLANGWAVVEFD